MANAEAAERHQAEATRLRSEIEQLVQRARLLLHGDAANKPLAPRPPHPRRAERERELEEALEKAEWYRREIKRMRQELESRDRHSQMSNPWDARDKDPMELYNLLAERRKELQQLQRVSEGLEHAAEVQRKAENAQSAVRPEIEERLQKVKMEVDQQKRLNVKLQADRLKLSNQRKAIEEEIRKVGSELRSKAALLHRKGPTGQEKGSHTVLEQLRREVDILRGALRQDERKHRAMLKEDSQEVDFAAAHVQSLQKSIEEREATRSRKRGKCGRRRAMSRILLTHVSFAAMSDEAERNRLFEIVRDGSYAEAKKVLSEADMSWKHSVSFAAMSDEAERNRLFEIVRDGSYAEAKKVLSEADMSWKHSALRQNFLFFIAARRRRGSEMLAKQCVAMGVDLEDIDVYGQTPLFWAASRGNMLVVQFLFQLGFEVNFRDYARKTALFFAIENSHLDVADYLIERAASTKVQSNQKKTPQASRFAAWEWAQAQEESEPLIERSEDNVVLESHQYFVCSNARGCSKRLRCSELEFAADHAHLHQDTMWYRSLTTEQAEAFVHVNADEEQARLKVIEEMATGGRPSAFTLPAVSQQTHTMAGYVHASFADQTLVIKHCKVDRPHQGRGLGGLLIQAAEKHAQKLGAAISTVKLSVLETNEPARKCYAKSGFQYCGESPSIFPPCNCPADSCHCANKIKWLSMEKRVA
ncbi:ANKRD65 [Symbiodinium sp. CCMP2592]|nr:ANKRD65 [Symbiodinium sp. CCMP2592]